MHSSIFPHHVSCSLILAAALSDLFPAARLLNFQATEKCFLCDFTLPFSFEKEMLPLLEDRMRAWVKKNIPIQKLEMIPSNAAQFLEHHGKPGEAAKARTDTGLVQLLRLDHFVGRSPGTPLKTTGEIKFFKLAVIQNHNGSIRLIGCAAFSKDELKEQAQVCKTIPSHLKLIEKLELIQPCPGGWIWNPRGEKFKNNLIEMAVEALGVDQITTTGDLLSSHAAYVKTTGRPTLEIAKLPLGRGGAELFETPVGTTDRFFFTPDEASVISFLQIIAKFLTIFSFEFEVVIVGKISKLLRDAVKKVGFKTTSEQGEFSWIEFRLQDGLGRSWAGPRMWHEMKAGVVTGSLFYSLERFVALLVERNEGELPVEQPCRKENVLVSL